MKPLGGWGANPVEANTGHAHIERYRSERSRTDLPRRSDWRLSQRKFVARKRRRPVMSRPAIKHSKVRRWEPSLYLRAALLSVDLVHRLARLPEIERCFRMIEGHPSGQLRVAYVFQ